jgi:glycosyltransferase involved in cell wall biosynthesis
MKICLINALYSPYVGGGAEVYVEKIANELSKEHEVIVISSSPYLGTASLNPFVERIGNIKLYRFYPMNVYHAWNYRKKPMLIKPFWHLVDMWNPHVYSVCKKILQKEKPDIVHSHCLRGLSTAVFHSTASLRLRHIHTLHDYGLLCRWNDLIRGGRVIKKFNSLDKQYMRIMRNFSGSVDVVLAPSQFILDIHQNHGYFPNSQCLKLPIGIELVNIRRKCFDKLRVMYAGQLSFHKGIHLLIRAFENLSAKNIELHIAGRGPLFDSIRRYVGRYPHAQINCYGYVSDQALRELYQLTNLTVVPSIWYDNCPLVVLESFSYANPVAGSRIGGIPEIIKDGYNGFLFDPGDVTSLCRILKTIGESPHKLERLSENAWNTSKEYSLADHIKKLMGIYKSLAA